MRRQDRKAQVAKEALAQKRLRGHRVKFGLEELGDLDAVPLKSQRTEAATTPSATDYRTLAPSDDSTSSDTDSDCQVSRTVFGPTWAVWRSVKETLFDPDVPTAKKQTALMTVSLWHARARKHRCVPPYVEATELLMEVVLSDESGRVTARALTDQYGAAISRSVHVMTGSFATGEANTYRKRAREIGYPEEAVEVRQRVAHGALPSLSELRWVCGLVLQFLFIEYWMVQERHVKAMEAEAAAKSAKASDKPVPAPKATSVDEMKELLAALDSGEEAADHSTEGEGCENERPNKDGCRPPAVTVAGWTLT